LFIVPISIQNTSPMYSNRRRKLWSWSYGSLIYSTTTCVISAYHHKSCEFKPRSWRSVLNTTLCDKVSQWLATGRWFSSGTPVSSINKTYRDGIAEILLKVALNTINHKPKPSKRRHDTLSLFLSLMYNIPYAQQGTSKGSKDSKQQSWPGGGYRWGLSSFNTGNLTVDPHV